MFVIICCCHLQVLPVNDLIGLSWCMDGEQECVLHLPGMCAGSLHRECLRQGQGFAPAGDAAEGERSWWTPPGLGAPFFPPPPQSPYPTTDIFFFSWLFMSRVRRNSGRRMAQRLWGTRGWMWQRIEFWDLDSASCLNQQGNGEGSTKDPVPCLDTKCTWKSSHGVISTEEQTGQA